MTEQSEAPDEVVLYERGGKWLREFGKSDQSARYIRESRHREAVELLRELRDMRFAPLQGFVDAVPIHRLRQKADALLSRESDGAKEKPSE